MVFMSLLLALGMASLAPATAGPLEDAFAAYQAHDYETVEQAAAQGDASAQYILGIMYSFGHGAPRDYPEAARWYRLAAEQGIANAQFQVGFRYDNGLGVVQEPSKDGSHGSTSHPQHRVQAQVGVTLETDLRYHRTPQHFGLGADQGGEAADYLNFHCVVGRV
jgi:TPR repeat protein